MRMQPEMKKNKILIMKLNMKGPTGIIEKSNNADILPQTYLYLKMPTNENENESLKAYLENQKLPFHL